MKSEIAEIIRFPASAPFPSLLHASRPQLVAMITDYREYYALALSMLSDQDLRALMDRRRAASAATRSASALKAL